MRIEDYEPVSISDLHVGDEIIMERKRFDYKKGFPIESVYYRTIVGRHKTVGGMMFDLTNEPNLEFPDFAPWYSKWIYAGNSGVDQMWRKKR